MASLWVAVLHISDRTAQKIINVHNLDPDDVRQALVCRPGLTYVWDVDDERGGRAIIETSLGGRRILAVLYPAVDPLGDAWNLGSAYDA